MSNTGGTSPPAPDTSAITDNAQAITSSINQSNDAVNNFGKNAGSVFNTLLTNLNGLATGIQSMAKSMGVSTGATNLFGKAVGAAGDVMNELGGAMLATNLAAKDGAEDVETYAKTLDATTSAGEAASAMLKSLTARMGVMGAAGAAGLGAFLKSADEAKKFEGIFLQTAASSGQLGKLYSDAGGAGLSKLGGLAENTEQILANITESTHGNFQEIVSGYALLEKQIPGFLASTGAASSSAKSGMNQYQQAILLAAGTGRGLTETVNMMGVAFRNGLSPENAAQYVAQISRTSQENSAFGLTLADTSKFMGDQQNSFAMLSHGANDAQNVLSALTPEFTKMGYSAEQAAMMTSGLVGGLRNMNTAQLALLSQRSGGPGGMQGAYQVKELLAQGKISQVAEMATKSLESGFGGPVVTRADAAAGKNTAQYTKQLQLLKSGVLGIKAADDDQANAIIELMSKKDTGGIAKLIAAQAGKPEESTALSEAVIRGQGIKDKFGNIVKDTQNRGISTGLSAEYKNLDRSEIIAGTSQRSDRNEDFEKNQAEMRLRQNAVNEEMSNRQQALGNGREYTGNTESLKEKGDAAARLIANAGAGIVRAGLGKDTFDAAVGTKQEENAASGSAEDAQANIGARQIADARKNTARNVRVSIAARPNNADTGSFGSTIANASIANQNHAMHVEVDVKGICIVCHTRMDEQSAQHNPVQKTGMKVR